MIRVIIYLIVLAALAYGAVWLAERPGEVAITWQGERIDTSVMVLAAAVATFQELASREDTRVLGLHGLFVEAQRRHDHAAALGFAEEAARHDSTPVWAAQAVLEFRCVAGDWTGALERLDRNLKSKLIDRRTYRRQRAVLLTAQAQTLAATEPARAAAPVREAAKLAADLVPAAALAGRLLGEAGERRKASRIIERAWRVNPHPD